ncbi:hypothetical protein TRVL_04159 [Trypanosoma vivax]|nr:hypothetical protein TRVL_04159 [Trypanosoma vivax]
MTGGQWREKESADKNRGEREQQKDARNEGAPPSDIRSSTVWGMEEQAIGRVGGSHETQEKGDGLASEQMKTGEKRKRKTRYAEEKGETAGTERGNLEKFETCGIYDRKKKTFCS